MASERLRLDGQRLTNGRKTLLCALAATATPMTIPSLMQANPTLAQSSVYRNLAVLEVAGLVTKIAMGDDHAHYELAEGLTNHHHHHLVCTACGAVSDVTLSAAVEQALDRALVSAAARAAFQLEGHRLDLIGTCAKCTR